MNALLNFDIEIRVSIINRYLPVEIYLAETGSEAERTNLNVTSFYQSVFFRL